MTNICVVLCDKRTLEILQRSVYSGVIRFQLDFKITSPSARQPLQILIISLSVMGDILKWTRKQLY